MVSEPLTIHELSYNYWQMVMCRSLACPFLLVENKRNASVKILFTCSWTKTKGKHKSKDDQLLHLILKGTWTPVPNFWWKTSHLWISHVSSIIQPRPSAVQTVAELSVPLCLWLTSEPSNRISSCSVIQLSTGQLCLFVMHIAYACVLYSI